MNPFPVLASFGTSRPKYRTGVGSLLAGDIGQPWALAQPFGPCNTGGSWAAEAQAAAGKAAAAGTWTGIAPAAGRQAPFWASRCAFPESPRNSGNAVLHGH